MAAIVVVAGAVFLWTMRVPTVAGGVKSIAVIPLQNLSGDPAQEYRRNASMAGHLMDETRRRKRRCCTGWT